MIAYVQATVKPKEINDFVISIWNSIVSSVKNEQLMDRVPQERVVTALVLTRAESKLHRLKLKFCPTLNNSF